MIGNRKDNSNCGGCKLLIALSLLFALAVPAWAQDEWVKLYENPERIVYFNKLLVEDCGDYIASWTRQVFSESASTRMGASYAFILYGSKKGSRQIRTLQMATYDKNDKLVELVTEKQLKQAGLSEWETVPARSMADWIWAASMFAMGIKWD